MFLDEIDSPARFGNYVWCFGIAPDLWDAAMRSFEKNRDQISKPYLISLVDYRISKKDERMWIMDFSGFWPRVLARTWCAHGKGSGSPECERVGKNDRKSCVGGFVTDNTWLSHLGQEDKTGKKVKRAMKLHGLDPTNDNANRRGIRWHGAHYVKPNSVAQSWGCICPPQDIHDRFVATLSHGTFVFTYFGEDTIEV